MKAEISALILGFLAIGAGLVVFFLDWREKRRSHARS